MKGYIERAGDVRIVASKRLWPVVVFIFLREQADDIVGIGVDEVCDALAIDRSDAGHRLSMLMNAGMVHRVDVPGRKAYYTIADTAAYIANMIIYPPKDKIFT